ncbi:MAG: hypothetical protein H6Q26_1847, partial [Bacteroidetes bacterium]|nr:hypothetical protein [Bacteroidota bacterium]
INTKYTRNAFKQFEKIAVKQSRANQLLQKDFPEIMGLFLNYLPL